MQQLLYERYSSKLLAVSMRYSKLQSEAEDIVQEAFVKIFKNIKNFRQESSLWFWMKRIVVNTALNFHRSKLYLFPMVDSDQLKEENKGDYSLSDYHYNELLEMVQELPDGCQVIFNLFAIEGYKHYEIAEMLGVSEGTSKSQYSRARQLLQQKLLDMKGVEYGRIK
ncbi:MAG: RNA polymerase sigma factor [Cyclobacteriaceae bacterium]